MKAAGLWLPESQGPAAFTRAVYRHISSTCRVALAAPKCVRPRPSTSSSSSSVSGRSLAATALNTSAYSSISSNATRSWSRTSTYSPNVLLLPLSSCLATLHFRLRAHLGPDHDPSGPFPGHPHEGPYPSRGGDPDYPDVGLIDWTRSLSVVRIAGRRSVDGHAEEGIVAVSFRGKHDSMPFRLRARVDETRVIPTPSPAAGAIATSQSPTFPDAHE